MEIDVWNKTDGRCWYCGKQCVTENNLLDTFTVDHVVPISNGVDNSINNRVPCCKSCNSAKGKKSLEEFRFYRSMKLNHSVMFTIKQVKYLATIGFTMPIPDYKFYFETGREL